ncbi:MAG: hypothetical protein GWM98_24870, partial [Nitrospinaceae bacterium]|nr:hypothetical protein [Nitrospinaceae bacterium]NIR57109.1 hypothetical protein [Nitrospinaceae bacterium]NIS87550.1 hypothetical protein [Nitrospinaceae bacterium]NIT84420.1 hypothetical protein [Nitrospinaceae bacterium]NIU46607.1 hypothetical protein [Nitrospinaceae bacterium]
DKGQEIKFDSIKSREFSLDLLFDGTGASGTPLDVQKTIEDFEKTVGYSGKAHRTKFLKVQWGNFIATCVMESHSINYKLFRPDGTPLRVVISATFKEHKPKPEQEKEKNASSPDRMHL